MLNTRGRALGIVLLIVAGGLGVLSSTQPWLHVRMRGTGELLAVPGANALPTLAPLSLTVLAIAGALTIAGLVFRYLIAGLAALLGIWLLIATVPLVIDPPLSAAASTLTAHTGLAGESTLAGLVDAILPTAWPTVSLLLWLVLIAGCGLVAFTAHAWRASDRRFRTGAAHASERLDAIDSWDELSRGADPTGSER